MPSDSRNFSSGPLPIYMFRDDGQINLSQNNNENRSSCASMLVDLMCRFVPFISKGGLMMSPRYGRTFGIVPKLASVAFLFFASPIMAFLGIFLCIIIIDRSNFKTFLVS